MIKSTFQKKRPSYYSLWKTRENKTIWIPLIVIAFLLLLTLTSIIYVKQEIELNAQREFNHVCNEIKNTIETRLHAHAQMLRSGSALIENSVEVTRQEWRTFVQNQKIEMNLPGIQGIGFTQIIHREQLQSHIRKIRKEGFLQYTILPEGDREIYTSITLLEPFLRENLRAPGYNMFSEPVLRKAMEYSRDLDQAVLSGKVMVVQEIDSNVQAGAVMIVPVYNNSHHTRTIDERRNAIRGWVYSPFLMNDFINSILDNYVSIEGDQYRVEIFDDSLFHPNGLLYDNNKEIRSNSVTHPIFETYSLISLNNHRLYVRFSQYDEGGTIIDYSKIWIIGISGSIMIVMLCVLFLMMLNTNYKAHVLANALTQDLQESTEKFHLLIESTDDIIFTLDTEQRHTGVFGPWVEQSGMTKEMFIGKTAREIFGEGHSVLHESMNQRAIAGEVVIYEWRSGTEDNPVFIQTKLSPMKDPTGTIFGIVGVGRNITERKQMEIALHASEEKFSKAFYISPDAISITRLSNGQYYDVNKGFLDMSGYSREELINKTSLEVNLWDNPNDRQLLFDELQRKKEAINLEIVFCPKNKEKVIALVSSRIIEIKGEEYILSIIRDITARKRSEQEIFEAQMMLNRVINLLPIRVFWKDKNLKYLGCNEIFAKDAGKMDPAEVVGHDDYSMAWKEHAELYRNDDRETIQSGKAKLNFEEPLLNANGSQRWILTSKVPLTDYAGNIVGVLGTYEDISERKVVQDRLLESEEKYRGLVENSPDAIAIYVDGKIVFTNNQCAVLYGVQNKNELIGKPVIQFVHPDNRQRVFERMKQMVVDGKPLPTEIEKFIRFDGSEVMVEVKAIPTIFENKPAVQIIAHDITERIRIEKALRESEEIFSQLMEHSPIHIFFKDHNMRATRLSRNFEQLIGRPIHEILGKNMDELFPSDFAKKIMADDLQILNNGQKIEIEEELNGRSYLTIKFPINIEGKPRYLAGFTIDITERKRAEEVVIRNERILKLFVEHSPAAIAMFDTSMRYIVASRHYLADYDIKEESIIGRSHYEIFPEIPDRWKVIHNRCLHGATESCDEDIFPRANGTTDWIRWEIRPWYETAEKIGGIILFSEVITERKQEEEQRRQTEEKFRNLVESTDGIVWEADAETFMFSYVSKQAERLLGYPVEEWYTKGFWAEHLHPDDKEKTILYCVTCTKEMKSHDFIYRFIAKDGHFVWLRDIVNVVVQDGKPVLLRGLMIDITTQKKLEETLHESEAKLKKAQHQARMGSWTWNIKQNTVDWSDEMYEIFGIQKEQFTGSLDAVIAQAIHPDDRAAVEQSNRSVSLYKKPVPLEYRILLPDQSVRYVWGEAGEFILDEHGNPAFLSGTVQDITERKNNEQIIRDVQRRESIGVLAGGIAHDFNNLLSVMMGNVSLAQSRISPDHPAIKNIERALSAMERASTLTKQMLAYSGKGKFQAREIDLVALVQEHINLFEVSLPKNVQLVSTLSPTPVFIKGDPGQIDQIVMNLIINGGEAIGSKQGTVSIDISSVVLSQQELSQYSKLTNASLKEGGYALLKVQDNGIGMSKETQTKIFDPFFTTKFVGRGLGLSAVLGIIRGNEGGIAIDSTEGVGTTFRVLLPLIQSSNPDRSRSNSGAHSLIIDNIKILVIDDEQYVVEMALDIIESGKYQHLSAVDPEKGITLFQEQWKTIDLVILDYSMPKLNGREVFAMLRKINPSVKVIISSGYSEEEIVELMGNDIPNAFIQKPYAQEDLLIAIKRVLQSA